MNKTVERRTEFLKLEAYGMSRAEIVKELSVKYHCTERNIYFDSETRKKWQPVLTQLCDMDKARLIVANRYEHLYRFAMQKYMICEDQQKPLYLKEAHSILNSLASITGADRTIMQIHDVKATSDIEDELSKYSEIFKSQLVNGTTTALALSTQNKSPSLAELLATKEG